MQHQFFGHGPISANAARHTSFVPKAYDLNVRPNAMAKGIPVEADDYGRVVAVKYPNGHIIRNNFQYIIHQTPIDNSLVDRNRMVHPLD